MLQELLIIFVICGNPVSGTLAHPFKEPKKVEKKDLREAFDKHYPNVKVLKKTNEQCT